MGGHGSYSFLHTEKGWKPLKQAKLDWKWPGIIFAGVTTYAVCNEYYLAKRLQRNNDRDFAFMQIKQSFGTLHPDFVKFHEDRNGKIGVKRD